MYCLAFNSFYADSRGCIIVVQDGEQKEINVALADILAFVSGATEVPPMEFTEQPTVLLKSKEDEGGGLTSSCTCANELYLPTVHDKYKSFKYSIVFGITCAIGLGMV